MRLGALEAGGTKMVCAVGNEKGEILDRMTIPTETPEITVPEMIRYFKEKKMEALGIGCFGPLDLRKESAAYGTITTTPKLAWAGYHILDEFKNALKIPVEIDTDVNAALLGEAEFGAARGKKNSMYITIGTGIGAGVMTEGMLLHGMMHPEAGHILLSRKEGDTFEGCCPYHKNCFESLASGPAIMGRYGMPAASLTDQKEVWELEAYYIAQALVDYACVLSPEIIILGGGVMNQKQLYPLIRKEFSKQLNGYLKTAEIGDLSHYISEPLLNGNQGIAGCLVLAKNKLSFTK